MRLLSDDTEKMQSAKCKISNQLKRTLRVLPLIRLASQATFPQGGRLSKSVAFCGENLNERVAQSKDKRIKPKNNVSLPRKSAKQKITCHPERRKRHSAAFSQSNPTQGRAALRSNDGIYERPPCHPERSTANELTQLQNGYSRGAQSKFCG